METTLKVKTFMSLVFACVGCLWTTTSQDAIEASQLGVSHLGTFEGSTTFTTSSSNGINPGLFIEVVDDEGNLKHYSSEDGIITIPDTKEGAYVTQAKLLGKTKYRDQDTNELLDVWEEGRNLTLESVQMPVLKATGKNLFDGIWSTTDITGGGLNIWCENYIEVNSNATYYYSRVLNGSGWACTRQYDADFNLIKESNRGFTGGKITFEPNTKYIKIATHKTYIDEPLMISITKEEYEPYKSNILTVNEDVTLRGVGDVKDELDLLTGEVAQRVGKTTITGDLVSSVMSPGHNNNSETICFERFGGIIPFQWNQIISADWPISNDGYNSSLTHEYFNPFDGYGIFRIKRSRLETEDVNGFKKWLNENPITIYHPVIGSESIKTVDLKGTHQFPLLNKSFVQLKGEATPVITSITVPSESLPFTLDPNQETGQQFIAPEFEVTNDSNAPLSLTLKTFEQMTDVLNDVLPTKYDSWEGLSKEESKDIALGLVAKTSTDWLDVIQEPHWVSETTNKLLGTIKPKGTVGFEFIAHHGQAFSEVLNPSYKLTFVFDLLN